MLNSVIRSEIFKEFNEEEREYWFGITNKAVSHHVDTLYYSVFIKGDTSSTSSDGAIVDLAESGVGELLFDLACMRSKLIEASDLDIKFHDLIVCRNGAAIAGGLYGYHLSYGAADSSEYDVFISNYLPNDDTPRIHVQLRTRSLVLNGLYGAIESSFEKVIEILSAYRLTVDRVLENRIDYAFHTNSIQAPHVVFGDESLKKHLKTTFRECYKHSWLTGKKYDFFDLDYFALGSRRANSLFFRVYDKTKEVVQQNYKGFFFEIWRERGLISRYDQFVYARAYELNSFKTGCLVGRVEWYLRYGKNEARKAELRALLDECNIRSDNNVHIEESIKGVLPPTTLVLNIEFETKRKYYVANSGFFRSEPFSAEFGTRPFRHELEPLYRILGHRREIINDLTERRVSFNVASDSDVPCDFWARVKRVRIGDQPDHSTLELYRTYSRTIHGAKIRRNLMNNISSFAIFKKQSVSDASFGEDMWDAITSLNDNDLIDEDRTLRKLFDGLQCSEYGKVRRKKARKLKPFVENLNKK